MQKKRVTMMFYPQMLGIADEIGFHTNRPRSEILNLLVIEALLSRIQSDQLYGTMVEALEIHGYLKKTDISDFVDAVQNYYKLQKELRPHSYRGPYMAGVRAYRKKRLEELTPKQQRKRIENSRYYAKRKAKKDARNMKDKVESGDVTKEDVADYNESLDSLFATDESDKDDSNESINHLFSLEDRLDEDDT